MKTVNIGIIGLGNVGSAVVNSLIEKKGLLEDRAGMSIRVLKVFDKDPKKMKAQKLSKNMLAESVKDIISDEHIDIIVELIGGVESAREIVLDSFRNKKHVVTANKALLAEYGDEIFEKAKECGCLIGFEASVCGAIPIIKTLKESFIANKINSIYGIVNGTCNFVLGKMAEESLPMDEAIRLAKKKGIAEADSRLDLEGIDSSHKLAILSLLCFGRLVRQKDIYVEGINDIELQDITYAKIWGYDVKLLAIAKVKGNKIEMRVHPTLISEKHLLSSVKNEDNAIFITGDMIGDSMLYGKGAGSLPASSSAISDIIEIGCNIDTFGVKNRFGNFYFGSHDINSVSKIGELVTRYYVRFSAIDRPGVLAGISGILAKNGISIATVSQKERKEGQVVPIVMLTHDAKESSMDNAMKAIDKLKFIKGPSIKIRIER